MKVILVVSIGVIIFAVFANKIFLSTESGKTTPIVATSPGELLLVDNSLEDGISVTLCLDDKCWKPEITIEPTIEREGVDICRRGAGGEWVFVERREW